MRVEGGVSPSAFPSASALAPAPVDLGALRNGLGSLRNLELLLRSIRVGPRSLFAAVAAVHDDCAGLAASVAGLERSLLGVGVSAASCSNLAGFVRQSLEQAEAALARVVKRRRLSVSDRLALESEVTLAAGNLDAALPLAAFVHRAARGSLPEPTPVALVHRSRVEGPATAASLCLADRPDPGTLAVDLDAARMLLAVAVALVARSAAPEAGRSTPGVSIVFSRCKALGPVTTISRGAVTGELVSVATLPTVEPTLACARAAAAGLRASFQLDPDGGRARIAWPEGQRDERTGSLAAASRLAPSSSRL